VELEEQRLEAVRRYDVLDRPPDGAFDRVTALAARIFAVPISIVSIVDHDRIWFTSHHGIDVQEIDRDPGLCASAVLQDGPWIVEDAAVDPRTLDNPLVAGELGLRFYAGIPLKVAGGWNLGTLNVIDVEPREITAEELDTLDDLASIVVDELELRLATRRAFETRRRRALELNDDVVHGIATANACLQIGETAKARSELDRTLAVTKRIVAETLAEIS
jgi:eukaryotic-like serine/threonine-protein kinase